MMGFFDFEFKMDDISKNESSKELIPLKLFHQIDMSNII